MPQFSHHSSEPNSCLALSILCYGSFEQSTTTSLWHIDNHTLTANWETSSSFLFLYHEWSLGAEMHSCPVEKAATLLFIDYDLFTLEVRFLVVLSRAFYVLRCIIEYYNPNVFNRQSQRLLSHLASPAQTSPQCYNPIRTSIRTGKFGELQNDQPNPETLHGI